MERFNFGDGIYRDVGCGVHNSCLNCPEPRCLQEYGRYNGEPNIIDAEGLTPRDYVRLGRITHDLKLGLYDVLDGPLPFEQAIAKIRGRMILLNKGLLGGTRK